MLQAVDLTFAYGITPVVRHVDLEIDRGGLVGILGPNGSGKTTLVKLLAGILRPSHGWVSLDGCVLDRRSRAEVSRRLATVPQETHLAFDYSVLEVALMGRYPHLGPFAFEGPSDLDIARRALAATGTADLESRSFMTLSGGEKQRVVIASALAQIEASERLPDDASRVLLLDEPTASLDPAYQLEVADILRGLNDTWQLTVVVCTHDLNFAAGLCDTLVMLRAGHILAAGATSDVLNPEQVRRLYDIEADIGLHPMTGRLTVTPLGRTPSREAAAP